MTPGQIVEYIEQSEATTAVCLEDRGSRVRVLTENRREANLANSRLIHVSAQRISLSQSRGAIVQQLKERAALRRDMANRIDVHTLWELLREDGGEYNAHSLAELTFGGPVDDDHTSAMLRAMLSDRIYFRFRTSGFKANSPETVQKIVTQKAREQEKERLLEAGCKWIQAVSSGKAPVSPPDGWEEIVEILKEYAVFGKGARRATQCEELLRRAGMTHPLAPFNMLVRLGVWSPDENLLVHRHGIRRTFPSQVVDESRSILKKWRTISRGGSDREDLQKLETLSIDSVHTHDIDDAVSIESDAGVYRIGIHIADVSAVVPLGSALDTEAALRGTSLYLPDERIPMFPWEISEDVCSLREKEVRPAVSFLLEVDEQGEVLRHQCGVSWIRVHRRLSYEEADEMIKEAEGSLRWLHQIAMAWRKERVARGALLLPLPEVSIRVEEDGTILVERRDREDPAQILVSEMMIQANSLAALDLYSSRIPCIFRTQGEPRERIVSHSGSDFFLNYQQRKHLSRAQFQLEAAFHHGLGLEAYTTVTSPIRRYLDLVIQRQLVAMIRKEDPPYNTQDLQRIRMESEEIIGQAIQVAHSRQKYWLLRYLDSRRGEKTAAVVLGQYGNKIQLLLKDYMLETSLNASSCSWFQPQQEIHVRLLEAKPMEGQLRVEPC